MQQCWEAQRGSKKANCAILAFHQAAIEFCVPSVQFSELWSSRARYRWSPLSTVLSRKHFEERSSEVFFGENHAGTRISRVSVGCKGQRGVGYIGCVRGFMEESGSFFDQVKNHAHRILMAAKDCGA